MQIDKSRLGWFFVLIGLVFLVIFFTTDQAENPGYGFLLLGSAALFFGGSLVWRSRKPDVPDVEDVRFRTVRRIRQKSEERKTRKKKNE
jgi:hypothetical protein